MYITIKNEYLTVTVNSKGGEVTSIKSSDGCEYLWQGDPSIWAGQAPNLFPYIGRMTKGKYIYDGKEYKMPIHGFLPEASLTIKKLDDDKAILMLTDDVETREHYPFAFILEISYVLEGPVLKIGMTVKNEGCKRMFFGIGGHPGFNVPLEEGLKFEDYRLEFDQPSTPSRVGFTKEEVLVSGIESAYPLQDQKVIPLAHDLFDEDAIILKNAPHTVTLCSDKGSRKVTVRYPDVDIIGFWHMPKMEAPYVCIEPWSSLPSRAGIIEDISCQKDLIALDPQQSYTNNWEIEIIWNYYRK